MTHKNPLALPYSPNLKEAMAEIRAVLTKHDVAAYVLLHEPGFSEFLMAIDPSWSVMRFDNSDPKGLGIRFRAMLEEFGGDREAQRLAVEGSVNLVIHFWESLLRDAEVMHRLERMLREHFEITETEGVLTPHRPH
ncbi:MAG: hypothetical protein ACREWE_14710 [Gammaproteobacteria bacterium]